MTLVSVVIPAFNSAPWVGEALTATLMQTHSELEILVVDDGSTDATAEVVTRVGDERVRLIRQPNRGQAAAANRGAAEARGEYVKFLDADDWLNPEHIASQLDVLQDTRDHVASCRWAYFLGDPLEVEPRAESTDRDYADPIEWLIDSFTLDEGMMGGWRWLIPRSVWARSGGWDERLSLNNDFDFSIRLLLASRGVRFAPRSMYAYRKGISGALSSSTDPAAMESAFLTTECGCRALLAREDSPRTRRICANRWQEWTHVFYPEFPELAARAEAHVAALGGSDRKLDGGRILRALLPLIGWRGVRRLQVMSRQVGWKTILGWKARNRIRNLERS